MQPFTFVHAADLHLAAPFRGLDAHFFAARNARLGDLLREAGFTALNRLVALCKREKAAFLLLAGDVYNQADGSLKARLALSRAFEELETEGIGVYWAHGNHDPLPEGGPARRWPANVCCFGDRAQRFQVFRDGLLLAVIHGISHASGREVRNLAKILGKEAKKGQAGHFQVGLLHCTVQNTAPGHENYAPCSLTDLTESGFDYLALGHIHKYQKLSDKPMVVYPGSVQGLNINEDGPQGCCLARVSASGRCSVERRALAPLRWKNLSLDIGGLEDEAGSAPEQLDALIRPGLALLERASREEADNPGAQALLCRLELRGRGRLDAALRKSARLADFTEALREAAGVIGADGRTPLVWLKDVKVNSAPDVDFDALRQRGDLLGETLRCLAGLKNPEAAPDAAATLEACQKALADLYEKNPALRRVLRMPEGPELADLAAQAELICLNLLAGE